MDLMWDVFRLERPWESVEYVSLDGKMPGTIYFADLPARKEAA
jgi:hypothetical protein